MMTNTAYTYGEDFKFVLKEMIFFKKVCVIINQRME